MFRETAEAITSHLDEIIQRWVDDLRLSKRTEVHNHLLTSEIANGVKAMLANLAMAIDQRESPDGETVPMSIVTTQEEARPSANGAADRRSRGTKPLSGPLERAQRAAAAHGKLRHSQGYEFHEVTLEYVKLRQLIWEALRTSEGGLQSLVPLDLAQYLDRLIDELMLTTIENYYDTSVRDLEKRAIHDPLTQLYNKEYFQQRLNDEMRRALRHSEPLTVAMIDMDLLKSINDTYGHQAGDAAISALASGIRSTSRQTDVPCRVGGDEFAVILPETSKAQSRIFAGRVVSSVQDLTIVITPGGQHPDRPLTLAADFEAGNIEPEQSKLPLVIPVPTISIGLASFPEDARNPETLVAKADAALYRAKREGRNRISH